MRKQLLLVLAVLVSSPTSWADPLARAATELDGISKADLAVLIWAQQGGCKDASSEMDRRICKELAAVTTENSADKVQYLRRLGAVTAGQFDRKRRSLPIVVEACLFCDGLPVEGETFLVVGRTGSSTAPRPLRQTSIRFKSVGEANQWANEVVPRLVGDFLFKLPQTAVSFRDGNRQGVLVDVRSYRIFDPCTGQVVASSPRLRKVPVDQQACEAARSQSPSR